MDILGFAALPGPNGLDLDLEGAIIAAWAGLVEAAVAPLLKTRDVRRT